MLTQDTKERLVGAYPFTMPFFLCPMPKHKFLKAGKPPLLSSPLEGWEKDKKMPEENVQKEPTDDEVRAMRTEVAAEEFGDVSVKMEETISTSLPSPPEEPPAEPNTEEDMWTGVNPALRQSFDDMAKKVGEIDSTLPERLKQAEKRIGSLTNELYDNAKQKPATEPAQEQPPATNAAADEDWEEIKIEYPDWAASVEKRFKDMDAAQNVLASQSPKAVQQLQANLDNLRSETSGVIERSMLTFRYPDWEQTITTPEYQKWLIDQPDDVKQLTSSVLAKDAISVLDKFSETHRATTNTTTAKTQRLAQSVALDGVKPKPQKAEADMTDAELRKRLASEIWA